MEYSSSYNQAKKNLFPAWHSATPSHMCQKYLTLSKRITTADSLREIMVAVAKTKLKRIDRQEALFLGIL